MTEKLPAVATIYPTYVGGGRTHWKGDVVFNNNLTVFFDCRSKLNDEELYDAQQEILDMMDFSEEDFEEEFGHRRPQKGEVYKSPGGYSFIFSPTESLENVTEARHEAQRVYDKQIELYDTEIPYARLEVEVLPDTAAYIRTIDERKRKRVAVRAKKDAKSWFRKLFRS